MKVAAVNTGPGVTWPTATAGACRSHVLLKGIEVAEAADRQTALGAHDFQRMAEAVEILRVGKEAEQFKCDQAAFDAALAAIRGEEEKSQQAARDKIRKTISERWPKATRTKSGLYYTLDKEGEGEPPAVGTTIKAHYTGRLLLGNRKFDSSYDRGEPIAFPVGTGRVIPGWDEALVQMKKGEKRTLIIPPELAYGERGAGGVIPPNAWLVFDVEMVSF